MGIGLRHLLVVDSGGYVVGIITRKDLVSRFCFIVSID